MGATDLRILVGVFVTLFGIAVAMAGGDLDSDEVWDKLESMDVPEDVTGMLSWDVAGLFRDDSPKPANTSITAELSTAQAEMDIRFPATVQIDIDESTKLSVGDMQITPDTGNGEMVTVTLNGFTGTFSNTDVITLSGTITGFDTDSLSMNYTDEADMSMERAHADAVRLSDLYGQDVRFDRASGRISTGSSDVTLANESAEFESFEGELEVLSTAMGYEYHFDGKLHQGRLQDGSSTITIGG